ncbi:ATP-binding cassette domain-containing protein [Alishewanella sp. 16-MA]|uniref:ATP-binding cassette domain-containing protein n=1 Tax=Alishewanella maricola TaxID=2795740 RepID=A0ABS8C7K4_9ALTE|nr:ATP-binding cassette domain-containing protein [Alishewanella maricola]MCB5228306.1 ATP-binding cassette domain-containing protein [Alishewanella maricola]
MRIAVSAIEKSYATVQAVRGVSFTIEPGEIFALLGPNGAGKSSIIRMLVGMTLPDIGTIQVEYQQQRYNHIPRRQLGYLPEDRGLYPDKSVEKNLLYLAQLHGLSKATAQQQMTHWLEVFELTERRHEDLKQLSKGNQQKVQLIAAVIHRPAVVILDEPFSGLDPLNQEKVVAFLKELRQQGMTVILSAHQMAMVEKLADRMLLMAKGKVVLAGTLAEIRLQAQPKQVVLIETEQAVSEDSLASVLADEHWQWQSSHSFSVTLANSTDLTHCLQRVLDSFTVRAVTMQAADLHQLYVSAMAEHQQGSAA